jgi:hypothetical protein
MPRSAAQASPPRSAAIAARDDDVSRFIDRVSGTNICETTLLATDYLNHFNEIVMLIEMIPDMPDMLEEAQAWQPKSYVEHFASSSCPFRELAIELYPHVPSRYRVPFETTVAQLEGVVDRVLRNAENALAKQDLRALRDRIGVALDPMRRLIDVAGGIIHGSSKTFTQDDIDSLLG